MAFIKNFIAILLLASPVMGGQGGFLFVTFKGESTPLTEQLYFGLSQDGQSWKALNDSKPVLVSNLGEKGVRDPYLLRSHDGSKFFIVATDLSIYFNPNWTRAVQAGSHSILVWESSDLVNWSQPRLVAVAPADAGCTWAPEAIYDDTTGDYLVFWAGTSASDSYSKQRIWACRTTDFRTFSTPFIYVEKANHVIDADIVKDGGTYYRFTKDETHSAIAMETSDQLTGTWTTVSGFTLASMTGYEGPECYPLSSNTWCLIADHYAAGTGYAPFVTTNLASGAFTAAAGFSFPFPFRHGSVLPITTEEYNRLNSATFPSAQVHLLFNEASGTNAADAMGHAWNGALVNGPLHGVGKVGNAVSLDGTDDYVSLPSGVLALYNDFTISAWVKLNSVATWSRIFDFGTGTGKYMFLTPKSGSSAVRFAITTSGSGSEQVLNGSTPLPTNAWTHVAVTHEGNTGILYVNGVEVGRNTSMSLMPYNLGNTTNNWIGRSQFSGDPYLNGMVDDFRIYSKALPSSSIQALYTGSAGALSFAWSEVALGAPALAGSAGSSDQEIALNASGSGIQGTADQGHFVYQPWTGDGVFTVRLDSLSANNTLTARAGIMFREDLSESSRCLFLGLDPSGNVFWQHRDTAGGETSSISTNTTPAAAWLRVTRSGNGFTAYSSSNGVAWSQIGASVTLSLPLTLNTGLALSSGTNSALEVGRFSFVTLTAYAFPALPAMPLVTPAPANAMPMADPAAFPEVKMDFAITTNGPFAPTWTSIAANVPGNGTPAWLRQAKFGIWLHYGPQANLTSGDWSAQHMYQQGTTAYNNHLGTFGHPTTNGYKDVIHAWNPTNYNPAALAQIFHDAGARFVLVQGVHHDNFDNWNSQYNPWNMVNFGARRDTMAEWSDNLHSLGMRLGVAFHHEYSWWFTQPDFLSDSSGTLAGLPYDAVTATNSAGTWWENDDVHRLYNQDLHKYQGISTPNQSYWNPGQGIFTNDLDYCHWYATQWALRMLDVVENYDPDFIYTDGNSTQPFSGSDTGTGYKCDAMQRVIAHYYNRTLERHGKLDTLAVVKFHNGDHIGTTFEGGYSSAIKTDQPWFAEMAIGDWFWKSGISYDTGGTIVYRLLEAISRDGAMMVNIPNRPDGALDSGATNMLAKVGQWMAIHGEGIYGSRAWAKPAEGSFRFTVGTNGCLYAYYEGLPSAGTKLTIASLATSSNLLVGSIGSVSLLGSSSNLVWSQTTTGLVVTCPSQMPSLPAGTAIGFKIGPASAVGSAVPSSVIALPGTNQISVSWSYPATAATFTVKRSTTHGGSYTSIATGLVDTAYADTDVSPGTLYYYVVSALDAGGESINSAETSASLAGPPSSGWLTEDIGAVGATGAFGLTNGVFTIQGSGADIWNSADEFRYVFQAVAGDFYMTARVLGMQNTASWAKAGVMMRETLDPASPYAINYLSPANGVALQQRVSSGGGASGVSNPKGVAAPVWVRLARVGDVFTAGYSPDGVHWTAMGSTTIAMNGNVYAGLAVCSVNDGTLCQAQFDNVTVVSGAIPDVNNSGVPASLEHRYSFNEASGTTCADSVGGAAWNGTLPHGGVFTNGQLVVSSNSQQYVQLPAGILGNATAVSVEAWVTFPHQLPVNCFFFGFGNTNGASGVNYLFCAPRAGRIAITGGSYSSEENANGNCDFSFHSNLHVTAVFNPPLGTIALYTNGALAGINNAVTTPLGAVSNMCSYIGRSLYSADPYPDFTLDEFRIYNGALTVEEIAAMQALGPDQPLSTNSPSIGAAIGDSSLTFSWPLESAGFTLQSRTNLLLGGWTSVVSPVPQITGNQWQIALPLSGSERYFRLLK